MTTTQFIKLATDINVHGKASGFHEYVENIIEPHAAEAADYYNLTPFAVVETAYKIAADLTKYGFAVLPKD